MELEVAKYKTYSKVIIWSLILSGLWPQGHFVMKKILSFINFFTVTTIMSSVINFTIHNYRDIHLIAIGLGAAVNLSSISSKIIAALQSQEDFDYLRRHLSTRFRRDLEQLENRRDLLFNMHIFTKFVNTHEVSMVIAMFMYTIGPLIALYKHGKYIRVIPSLYPFHYEPGDTVHWMIYAMEVTASIFIWFTTIGVDCGFCMYAMELCGESKILSRKFRELRVADDYKVKLKDCIERHHLIINAKNKLEDAFGFLTIWLALSGAVALCTIVFQITEIWKNHGSYLKIVQLSSLLTAKYLQVFMYAWYGNLVTEESEEFLYALYSSHWTDICNRRFKNDILIVLTQQPLTLVAKGCMNIQLDMFAKIAKTAVSYFFLLQTLNSEQE